MKKNTTTNKNKEPMDVSKFTTLEDLILAAMGPPDKNIVNFKMVQAILMILAQQLRMLERPVDYRSLEEETTAQKETEQAEREKIESKSKNSKKKSETSEKDKRESERLDREDETAKSDSERSESESERSESESEKAEKESKKRKKAGRDKKKTGQERDIDDHEIEKTEGRKEKKERGKEKIEGGKDKTDQESEKTEGEKEKTQGKKKKKEQQKEKTEGEKVNEGPEIEKTEGKKEKKERSKENTEGGRDKTDQESEKTEGEKEKTQGKKKKKEQEKEKTEGEKVNEGPEIEKTEGRKEKKERGKEKTEGGRDKTDQESEKIEGENEKTQGKKKKKEQEKEKTEGEKVNEGPEIEKTGGKKEKKEREREKAEGEKEKKGQEREKTEEKKEKKEREEERTEKEREKKDGEKEKKVSEGEKTEGKKEKKGRDRDELDQEREKKERGREKTEQEKEKTEREKEKTEREKEKTEIEKENTGRDREMTGREKEKTGQERQQTGREKEEKERNIPSLMEKPDREKEEKHKPTIEESHISVTDKDRVLLVEKIPAARRGGSQSNVGSIPVVTLSQFRILEAAVRALEEKVAPIPLPSMPDNQTLRDDLARGSASLTGTMEAMQVSARVQAAEEAINRMAEMLSNMAAQDTAQEERQATKKRSVKLQSSSDSETSTSTDLHTSSSGVTLRTESMLSRFSQRNTMAQKSSIFGVRARRSMDIEASKKVEPKPEPQPTDFVSHPEMTQALGVLQANLVKSLFARSAMVQKIAEQTAKTVQMAADRAALVTEVDDRIKSLTALLNKRAKQHENIDAEMTTQLDNFNVHLVQVRVDVRDGIILFESTGSEMQALKELGCKYDELVEMLDMTSHSHSELASGQNLLNDDVQGILTCIEMLQEEKSDRDEMLDRLRDKADFSAVSGLLPADDFKEVQADLEKKLEQCHGKFLTQETVWQSAIEDLTAIADEKSDLFHLLKLKEDTEHHLSEINKKIRCLAYALGEPKAALLARQLSQGARCGACSKPAIQHAVDKSYMKDEKDRPVPKPPRLPPAYYSYIGAGDPCEVETNAPTMDEAKQHVCHRWVGGSHTLLTDSVKRAKAAPLPVIGPPTRKYTQTGEDGKLYNMEETLDPCQQCNPKVGDEEAPRPQTNS